MGTILANGEVRKLNWRPGRKDFRDLKYQPKPKLGPLPLDVPELDIDIPIWNQSSLGSCTAHGSGSIWSHRLLKEGRGYIQPSRLFLYYGEREMEGTTGEDNGAFVRDGLKVMAKDGLPKEDLWPYDISRFTERPPNEAYEAALADIALEYSAVDMTEHAVENALADGNPITMGFTVFSSFNNIGADGIQPMPCDDEDVLGGHCVAIVGYHHERRLLIVRNSWGTGWGKAGRFYMPYDNLANCSDGWVLTKVA